MSAQDLWARNLVAESAAASDRLSEACGALAELQGDFSRLMRKAVELTSRAGRLLKTDADATELRELAVELERARHSLAALDQRAGEVLEGVSEDCEYLVRAELDSFTALSELRESLRHRGAELNERITFWVNALCERIATTEEDR